MKSIEENNDFLLSLNLVNKKISDKKKVRLLYTLSNRIERNYQIYKIKKHSEGYRTIYAPSPLLKKIQRNILTNILNTQEISTYAKAYHKGITLKDNALPHVNKLMILKLDIIDFFENISFYDVYKSCFNEPNFPKPIGQLLTYLCTYESRLPQGAPTSSYISNLVLKDFDEVLGKWCEENHISYTRYSDDMTFSGDFNPSIIIKRVRKMLYRYNLKINNKKIKVIYNYNQQNVTGIVVNKKMQTSSKYRHKIRQEIYYIKKYGLKDHLKKINYQGTPSTYINSLKGKINYILNIDQKNKEFKEYLTFLKEIK